MERAQRARTISAVTVVAIILATAVGVALYQLSKPDPPGGLPYGISISTKGSLEAGQETQIITTVIDNAHSSSSQKLFLSVNLLRCFRPLHPDPGDDPWHLPNVWNLSGIDLSTPKRFVLDATPVWGAEMHLSAEIWSPTGGISAVNMSDDGTPTSGVMTWNWGSVGITTSWPYEFTMNMVGPYTVGSEESIEFTVKGELETQIQHSLLYVSLEFKNWTLNAVDRGDNPWHSPKIWNVTGTDLSRGKQFIINASADIPRELGIEARIWSPIGSWSSVIFVETNTTDTRSLYLWGSQTFLFEISP